jgi:integrase
VPSVQRGIEERREQDGRVRYRVRVRRGRGRALYRTLPTIEEALAWRAHAIAFVEGRRDDPPPLETPPAATFERAITIGDAARRLCRGMKDGKVRSRDGRPYKPSVVRKYEEQLRTLVLPRIGGIPITALTTGDVQRFVDEVANDRTPEHGRKALTALRVALRTAVTYGELERNPCTGVCVPANPEGESPPSVLSPEECDAIVEAGYRDDARLERSMIGPLLALLMGSGLRLGEALALEWGPEGLDVDESLLRVRKSLDRVRGPDGEYPSLEPKSRAAKRDVPLAPEDVARLRRHRLATGRPQDGALVFSGPGGKALSPVPAYRAFKRACRAVKVAEPRQALERAEARGDSAGIRKAERALEAAKAAPLPRLHDCRHAFATHALAAGLSAHAVADLLGHADAGLVLRRYGHALPDEVAAAGERLSAWRRSIGVGMAHDWPTGTQRGALTAQPSG